MSMGEQIKAMRQIRGLTQGELAEKIEMATITIQQYERGVRTPKIEALQKIAQALEMPIGTFLPSMGMTENFRFQSERNTKEATPVYGAAWPKNGNIRFSCWEV